MSGQVAPRIGLLPLYLKLYDDVVPELRPKLEAFLGEVADALSANGLDVVSAPVCRERPEFAEALAGLADAGVDALVTLHLAYSPSLESAPLLAECGLPLILFDTTPSPTFDSSATRQTMLENHGIHGVQDLASVLRRLGKPYHVVAGHLSRSDVVAEVVEVCRAASAASRLRRMKVGLVGEPFRGMGDFAIDADRLAERLGPSVVRIDLTDLANRAAAVSPEALEAEAAADEERFDCSAVTRQVLEPSLRLGLALRHMLDEVNAGAFSMNFQACTAESGLPTVPFLECSKAMARGLGYAGEGDVLTASVNGALGAAYGDTTFTEMFCADWRGDTLFMSHMGECNPELAAQTPKLVEKEYKFSDVANPVIALFPLKPGAATLVNVTQDPGDSFSLIASLVEVVDTGLVDAFCDVPHFWIRPAKPVRQFLADYSRAGGTHHLGLMRGDRVAAVRTFAEMLGVSAVEV
jgi:L-arabinose isomerase